MITNLVKMKNYQEAKLLCLEIRKRMAQFWWVPGDRFQRYAIGIRPADRVILSELLDYYGE
ncbi:hypothetical protein [Desulfoscipio gibsoniae]|uniref:hypothetical protein n=1 Tax=Desulfoscipio gibsoniae TaxID=102134 RepID=UPI00031B0C51|nr:hypothetical protein [Desulfoscipio gibsoniae]